MLNRPRRSTPSTSRFLLLLFCVLQPAMSPRWKPCLLKPSHLIKTYQSGVRWDLFVVVVGFMHLEYKKCIMSNHLRRLIYSMSFNNKSCPQSCKHCEHVSRCIILQSKPLSMGIVIECKYRRCVAGLCQRNGVSQDKRSQHDQ